MQYHKNLLFNFYILLFSRQIEAQLRSPEKRRATRLLGDGMAKNPLKIGIIGCGRLGSHLANCLISFGESKPEDIFISTRRPETLSKCLCIKYNFFCDSEFYSNTFSEL